MHLDIFLITKPQYMVMNHLLILEMLV